MYLEDLVVQVKEELRKMGRFDMRTFAYVHFEYQRLRTMDLVEFFVYEKSNLPNRNYVQLTYDRLSGRQMYKMEIPTCIHKPVQKIVLGVDADNTLKVVSV